MNTPDITLRDLLAGFAMAGLLAGKVFTRHQHPSGHPMAPGLVKSEEVAEDAVRFADALVRELNQHDLRAAEARGIVRELAAIPFGQEPDKAELATLVARAKDFAKREGGGS